MENEKTFMLAERENLLVERLNYIFESNRAMVAILARELEIGRASCRERV